ncbi:MAG: hypothetical protein U0800_18770 [Isosphaeraceae bacterium]
MDTRIWSKVEEKVARILVLRGHEVSLLKVSGNMFTLKKNVGRVLEALEQGTPPSGTDAKLDGALDVRSITRAELEPDNDGFTLHVEGENPGKISYNSGPDARSILDGILEKSGRSFATSRESIGVFEALIPPGIVGIVGGLLWMGLRDAAQKAEAGGHAVASGRRKGLQQLLIWAGESLGTTGTMAVGVALLAMVLLWGGLRLFKRPERTVFRPESGRSEGTS